MKYLGIATFSNENFKSICDQQAVINPDLAIIIKKYGYPPLWLRPSSYKILVQNNYLRE
jgi:DNA-3-methyladenine glycosylase II